MNRKASRQSRRPRIWTNACAEALERRDLLASIAEFGLFSTGSTPSSIVSGPDGNLWFTEKDNDVIGQITPLGNITEYSLNPNSKPTSITSGPDGNLWFTEATSSKIGRITTAGVITEYSLTSGSSPYGITAGPDGNLWFTEPGGARSRTSSPPARSPARSRNTARQAAANPRGSPRAPTAPSGSPRTARTRWAGIVPSGMFAGVITEYSLSGGAGPQGITTGPDGNLWFTETTGNAIGRVTASGSVTEYSIPTASSSPNQIVTGPDGALYFTEGAGNKIGRITVGGTITEYAVPASSSVPLGIASGPDNHVWFTEASTSLIGRLNFEPVAGPDSYTAFENTTLAKNAATGVLANDFDPESDALSAVLVTGPAHGVLSLLADGSFNYTPDTGFSGVDNFSYKANDGGASSNTVFAFINVDAPPVAVNDAYTGAVNTTLVVGAATGVLTNDTDADGDPLSAVLVAGPSHGTLALNPDGSFTYIPNSNYSGLDSFTYQDSDGKTTGNTATVNLTIDTPPVAFNDGYFAVMNAPFAVGAGSGVLHNDTDADGDPLTAVLVAGPSHGTLTLNANGSFAYTPNTNYFGPDTFTYKDSDGKTTGNTATVTMRVDAPPVATNDSYAATEETPLNITAPGVLANDTDGDGDPLTAVLVAGPSHGTLTLNADGSFTYTPASLFSGADSFTYKASDGSITGNTATVTFSVAHVNHAPVATSDSYAATEETPLTIAAPGVLANDTDADGDPLTAVLVAGPSHGTLTLNADGSFSYTPAPLFSGADSFTYKASDGTTTGNTATVSLSVAHVNHAPVAVNDSYTTAEETPLTITSPGVLANDTDADGDPLTAALVTSPAHGTLTLNTDGSFTYTPASLFFGTDSFSYKVNDGTADGNTATVMLNVAYVNHAPVAVNDSFTTAQGHTMNVPPAGLLANDSDADGDPIEAVLVAVPTHGTFNLVADGSFTYTPDPGFFGTDSFTYKAGDGTALSNTATVTLTVTPDRAPAAVNDAFTTPEETALVVAAPGLLANDTDADGDPLTAVLVSSPAHGQLDFHADGSFTYTPDPFFHGSDGFTYRAYDGIYASNIATVALGVSFVNHAPTSAPDAYSIAQGATLTVGGAGVLSNDTDAEGDPLTAVLVNGPDHGALTLNPDGSFTYTPDPLYHGVDGFTYTPSDGTALGAITAVSLTVDPVNHAPVGVSDSASTAENVPLTIAAPGILGNDSDVDGDAITPVVTSGPAHGTLSLNPNGSYTYTPAANYNGPDAFTYKPFDGKALGNLTTVSLTVTPVNQAPVVTALPLAVVQGTVLSGVTAATFTDVDAGPSAAGSYAATIDWGDGKPTSVGTVTRTGGSFVVTGSHVYDQSGSFVLRVTVTDPGGASAQGTASTTVSAIPPQFALTGAINTGSNVGATKNPAPVITGTAPPGDLVTLYAVPSGLAGTTAQGVGQAVAGPDGTFRINSQALADGTYTLSMTAVNPNAPGSTLTLSSTIGKITVDTTSPHIVALSLDPTLARFYVTYQDVTSGMAMASILNPSNYVVARAIGSSNVLRNVGVTGVSMVSASNGTVTIAVTVNNGKPLSRSKLIFGAYGRTITDAAGNQLDGNFLGNFPTGGDGAGSSFVARIDVKGKQATTSPQHVNFAPVLGAVQVSFNRSAKVAHNHKYGAAHPRARRHV